MVYWGHCCFWLLEIYADIRFCKSLNFLKSVVQNILSLFSSFKMVSCSLEQVSTGVLVVELVERIGKSNLYSL